MLLKPPAWSYVKPSDQIVLKVYWGNLILLEYIKNIKIIRVLKYSIKGFIAYLLCYKFLVRFTDIVLKILNAQSRINKYFIGVIMLAETFWNN